ncbi:FecR family protein [Pseudopedobacter sp.]|uniref:FecR family protein n=1 Tax=Pseudopedobacter sp. TaxID=1936787 RepID=UPI003341D3B3
MNKKEEFKILVDKYLESKTSLSEEQRLFAYYEALQKHKKWDNNLMGEQEVVGKRLYSNILQEIAKKEPKKSLLKKWMVAAAAIVILGFSATLYILYHKETNNAVTQQQDILPGGNKAVLTLADGTTISLDDAANGELAKQKNTIVRKTEDGQLVYIRKSTAHSETIGKEVLNTITTPKGGQYQLILPDGTKVWLNSMSSLEFPAEFNGTERNVELKGEAYFEVAKNKKMAFKVKVGNTVVEVLGTHFNVMAYADEQNYKTTLLEGSVKVGIASIGKSVILRPGQQARIAKNNDIKVQEANLEETVAWTNGYFQFSRESIQDIMKKFERWYDIEVVYEGDIPKEEFVGKIRRGVTLSQALKILKLSEVNFKIEGRKVTVSD